MCVGKVLMYFFDNAGCQYNIADKCCLYNQELLHPLKIWYYLGSDDYRRIFFPADNGRCLARNVIILAIRYYVVDSLLNVMHNFLKCNRHRMSSAVIL